MHACLENYHLLSVLSQQRYSLNQIIFEMFKLVRFECAKKIATKLIYFHFQQLAFAAFVAVAAADAVYSNYGNYGYGGQYDGLVTVAVKQPYTGPIVTNNHVRTAIVATPVLSSVPVVNKIVSSAPVVAVGHDGHTGHVIGHTETVNTIVGTAPAVKTVALPTVVGPSHSHGHGAVPVVGIVNESRYGH